MPGGRIALAGVLVGGVAVVAFGTGFTTAKVLSPSDTVWMQKGYTITEINAPARHYEATVPDTPTKLAAKVQDPLQIVQNPGSPNKVIAVDPNTKKVYQIDPSTDVPQALPGQGTDVLANGGVYYVADRANSTLRLFNQQTGDFGAPITVPGGIASATITSKGVVYIGSDNGSVTTIDNGTPHTQSVGKNGDEIEVSIVGNQPIAIDQDAAQLHYLGPNAPTNNVVTLQAKPGSTVQVAPTVTGKDALFIEGNDIVAVSPTPGIPPYEAPLPSGDIFGSPIANDGKYYVADDTTNQVLVYDGALHLLNRIAVPRGATGPTDIQLIVKDGAVWANNPSSSEATVIQPDGKSQTVQKGTGDGVVTPGQAKAATHRSVSALAGGAGAGAASAPAPAPKTGKPKLSAPPASTSPTATLPPQPKLSLPPASPPPPTAPPHVTIPTTPPPTFPKPTLPPPTAPPVPDQTTPPHPGGPDTSPTLPSTPPQPSVTTPKMVTVPTGLEGQDPTAACKSLDALGLHCDAVPKGQAPKGTAPNQVTKVQDEGKSVPVGTSIEVDYYATGAPVTVPAFTKGEDPDTYCENINDTYKDALTCTTSDLGKGNPEGVVVSTSPAAGTTQPYGTKVVAQYHSSSAPIFLPAPGDSISSGGTVPTNAKQYCNYLNTIGFNCPGVESTATEADTDDVPGLADPGQALNTAEPAWITPAPSPTDGQPYNTEVTVQDFDTAGIQAPDETNQQETDACTDITSKNLKCGTPTTEHVDAQTPGSVISGTEMAAVNGNPVPVPASSGSGTTTTGSTASPPASTGSSSDPTTAPTDLVVASGTTITFSYDPGEKVPSVVGDDVNTAETQITNAGLTTAGGDLQTSDCGNTQTVTNQTPSAGTVAATGSAVTLSTSETCTAVPSVDNDDLTTAENDLTSAGLTYTSSLSGTDCGATQTVISESPGGGTAVLPGSGVSLTTSEDCVQVESCIGAQVGSGGASAACPGGGAGWAGPQELSYHDVASDSSCNTITGQSKTAGSWVPAGTVVTPTYYACSNTLQESHATKAVNINKQSYNLGGEFYYITTPNGPAPAGTDPYTGGGGETTGGFVPFSDGSCMAGTERLWQSSLPVTDPTFTAAGLADHYDYTVGGPFGGTNWVSSGVPGDGQMDICVYPPGSGSGVVFYATPHANPNGGPIVDWSWSTDPAGSSGESWDALPGA